MTRSGKGDRKEKRSGDSEEWKDLRNVLVLGHRDLRMHLRRNENGTSRRCGSSASFAHF